MKNRMEHSTLLRLAEKIQNADAILIGGGSGLSSAAGYDHYHWSKTLLEALAPFQEYYGFRSPLDGFYYCYSSYEEQWGYYSQYIRCMWETATGKPYLDLREIVGNKPSFVLTTNVDMQFERVFVPEQICVYQGSFGYCQCSQPCVDEIRTNDVLVKELTSHLEGIRLPSEFVPRCKQCGRILVPWVRDDSFLEGVKWRESVERYHAFLRHWILERPDSKLLLLELGVGEMTPAIIKLPFWELTTRNSNVFYACLNQKKSQAPLHLQGKSLYLQGDLAQTLTELRNLLIKNK